MLHISISNPSKSLLTSICYPEMVRFQSKACLYGCKHKDDAHKAYTEVMNAQHRSFTVVKSDLVLDMSHPFIGASPNGLVECSCCGKGTLEIKCPYSCRDKAFEEASKDKSFYLQRNDEGDLLLTKDHVYYYQIQIQMEVCQTEYCDFVVWSKDQLLCQRILYDKEFIKAKLDSLGGFIIKCVLPELIAKWFTKPELGTNDESTSDVNPLLDNVMPMSLQMWSTQLKIMILSIQLPVYIVSHLEPPQTLLILKWSYGANVGKMKTLTISLDAIMTTAQ